MAKVTPLRAKTMTLGKLQVETLELIRKLRIQVSRLAHEPGLSDREFLDQVVGPLETKILRDREMLCMQRVRDRERDDEPQPHIRVNRKPKER